MDTLTLLALALAGAAALVALVAVLRPRKDEGAAALAARLDQLAAQQSAAQSALGEQLQRQERVLTDAMANRMETLDAKLNASLVNTTKETQTALGDVRKQLAVIDAAQRNITDLSSQVVGLQDILSNKQARGAFGEVQLRAIVEDMLPPAHYEFQATLGSGKRVDCLLKLPDQPGAVPVDSKFPLEAYKKLSQAAAETERLAARREFAQAMRIHVADIATKYIVPGETSEFALMFLPSEAVYAEMHAGHPEIVIEAQRARVLPVSPNTMWALLNTMRAVLKDVRMREQAGVIQIEVGKMMEDVRRLSERVGQLQRHFDQAATDVREIRTSADKIVGRGERIAAVELEEPVGVAPMIGKSAR